VEKSRRNEDKRRKESKERVETIGNGNVEKKKRIK